MNSRSVRAAVIATVMLALFYGGVVWAASGSFQHLVDQAVRDWYYLAMIMGGFGLQVALVSELRRRHRLQRTAALTSGAGIGASTAGMVACCAHHIAELAPLIGATGAATFLIEYRIPFMIMGIGVNAIGVAFAAHRLRQTPQPTPRHGARSWAHS